jgi:fused signal recognition particle receptor
MLAAGDTFRAAAVEQLQVWGERNDIPVIAQKTGSDAASVVYDAYQSAIAKKIDILIADTAGRLHTQDNLMQELEKIKRVLKKHNEEPLTRPFWLSMVAQVKMQFNRQKSFISQSTYLD